MKGVRYDILNINLFITPASTDSFRKYANTIVPLWLS